MKKTSTRIKYSFPEISSVEVNAVAPLAVSTNTAETESYTIEEVDLF